MPYLHTADMPPSPELLALMQLPATHNGEEQLWLRGRSCQVAHSRRGGGRQVAWGEQV